MTPPFSAVSKSCNPPPSPLLISDKSLNKHFFYLFLLLLLFAAGFLEYPSSWVNSINLRNYLVVRHSMFRLYCLICSLFLSVFTWYTYNNSWLISIVTATQKSVSSVRAIYCPDIMLMWCTLCPSMITSLPSNKHRIWEKKGSEHCPPKSAETLIYNQNQKTLIIP